MKRPLPLPGYYTIKETSIALQVTTKTIHNYLHRGFLKAQKVNGVWMIEIESVRRFVEERRGQKKVEVMAGATALFAQKSLVDRERYEELLQQAGRWKAVEELLWEYKNANERLQARVQALEREIERLRGEPFWRRLFRR